MPATKRRSPIKRAPLRDAGQGLRQQKSEVFDDVYPWFAVAVMATIFAGYEWYRWASGEPPHPVVYSVCAVATIVITIRKTREAIKRLANLKTGHEGERYVGQFLQNELGGHGYRVFHDIEDERGNIDHVVIGPGGVFSIETKTVSKPTQWAAEVIVDGDDVRVDGMKPDRDPIVQTRACARSLKGILREYSGQDVSVRPVVVYPGWFVRSKNRSDVWVLNEKGLVAFIENEDDKILPEIVTVLVAALERYVRDKDKR